MTRTQSILSLIFAIAVCMPGHAMIVIDISEAVGGTRFEINGSVTITSGTSGQLNGFWLDDQLSGVSYMTGTNPTITHSVISGAGTVTTTIDGVGTVTNTQVFPTTAFSIITSPSLTYEIGNTFTLSGDFVTSQPYANFVPGTYSDNIVGLSFNGGLKDTNELITVNIAQPVTVPEPSLVVAWAGLAGVALVGRRRKRS